MPQQYNWKARYGTFEFIDNGLKFQGGETETDRGEMLPRFGNFICNGRLSNGNVKCRIQFAEPADYGSAGIIVRDNPEKGAIFVAGLGGANCAYSIRLFNGTEWNMLSGLGEWSSIKSGEWSTIRVETMGSRLRMLVDDVLLFSQIMPTALPESQVGIWCQSKAPIFFEDFEVNSAPLKAFVVMQFTEPYDKLHDEVIKPVCESLNISAIRADEHYGPGLILSDVVKSIEEASVVIAEITPPNQNVFYEVGYAHALKKPTILIAEKGKQLPFDISGFRCLLYENSISGKSRVESELRRHLEAILTTTGGQEFGQ